MTPEQKFASWMRNALQPCDWVRIESLGSGIPDVNVCTQGLEFWLELKVYVSGRTLLRKEQVAWGMRRAVHGGHAFVASLHNDEVHFWKFPEVTTVAHGKYWWITSKPFIIAKRPSEVSNFLRAACNSSLLDLIQKVG